MPKKAQTSLVNKIKEIDILENGKDKKRLHGALAKKEKVDRAESNFKKIKKKITSKHMGNSEDDEECGSHKEDSDDDSSNGSSSSGDEKTTSPATKKTKTRMKKIVKNEPSSTTVSNGKKEKAQVRVSAVSGGKKKEDLFEYHRELAVKYNKFIGGHMSGSGGCDKAIDNIRYCDGLAFALFLKNQRQWDFKPLEDKVIQDYKDKLSNVWKMDKHGMVETAENSKSNANEGGGGMKTYGYVLPHGSYLINLANPDKTKRDKSYASFLDDLRRCEQLGILLYNFHPGSTVGECSKEVGIQHIADSINRAHAATFEVIVVLENMAGQKNVIGSRFEDLRDIINLVKNKKRIGVCLDTCHLFAAGYDIRVDDKRYSKEDHTNNKFSEVLDNFDNVVGHHYLRGVHLNDSKSALSSGLDRHEHIGKGLIGLGAFRFLMNDDRFNNIPIVLETPAGDKEGNDLWKQEIKLLYSLIRK